MRAKRLRSVHLLFLAVMLLALPVAAYHLLSGRPAQAAMAIGSALIGLLIAARWLRQAPMEAPTVQVPTPPPRPRPVRVESETRPRGEPREGWLRNGLLAGLIATTAMTLALLTAYVVVVSAASPDAGLIGRWFWGLAHNRLTEAVGAAPILTLALQLALGMAFSVLYAGYAEPVLSGAGWQRGIVFALGLWVLSIVVFFPLVGAGLLGLELGAGPLPILGNLVVHLVYGAVLGAVYAIPESSGLDHTTVDLQAAAQSDRGAAVGLVAGAASGAVIGALVEALGGNNTLLPPGSLVLGAGFIGCAWGALLGSLAGLGASSSPPEQRPMGPVAPGPRGLPC